MLNDYIMMAVKALKPALISLLLFSILVGFMFVHSSKANPLSFQDLGEMPPKPGTTPPHILIIEPKSGSVFQNDSLVLTFDVSPPKHPDTVNVFLTEVSYSIDNRKVTVFSQSPYEFRFPNGTIRTHRQYFYDSVTLTDISEGVHSLSVTATYWVGYNPYSEPCTGAHAYISVSSSVTVTVDTAAPRVSVLPLENATYDESFFFSLHITDQSLSWIGYILDGGGNISVNQEALEKRSTPSALQIWAGNLTLDGLSGGSHSFTVYAKDEAGHTGISETLYFTITKEQESFPTIWIVVAIVVTAAVGIGFLFYFKKSKIQS